jgi:quinol monooxygenase YgiN
MYAVTVAFRLFPGQRDAFLPLMHRNARVSLDAEPGCRRFDVLTDPARPEEVLLYEIYDDRAAFDAHLASDHFREFDAAVASMILEKRVETWSRVAT